MLNITKYVTLNKEQNNIEMVDKNLVKTGQELYDELDYFHNNDLSICYAVDSLQGLRDWGRLQDMEKGLKLTMLNFHGRI